MQSRWFLLPCLLTVCTELAVPVSSECPNKDLEVVHEWKYIDYDFDSAEQKEAAIASGLYNYRNCVALGVDRWNGKTFVTVLSLAGVPASLNTVSNKKGPGGPLLRPYPDWSWGKNENCTGITMATSIAVDKCDRLWVLDAGGYFDTQNCPPQLLTFDLRTSQLLNRMEIPKHIVTNSTIKKGLLIGIAVKTSELDCDYFTVFMSEANGPGLIVYNGILMRRLRSSTMEMEPEATTFPADNGKTYQFNFGIWSMAISSLTQDLYFSALSSYSLAVVNTSETEQLTCGIGVQYHPYKHIFPTQPTALAASETGAVFVGLVNDTSIGCWNEFRNLTRDNIEVIAKNSETLQFVAGLKITEHPEQQLWALSNRYHKLLTKAYNFSEINFRILTGNVQCLIKDTLCERP